MGWWSDDVDGHEGFAVGVLKLDDGLTGTRYLATVDAPDPSVEITSVHYAAATCGCGWRSERITAIEPMDWRDRSLECSERVKNRLYQLWEEHIALMAYRLRRASGSESRAFTDLRKHLQSFDRCACGHVRSEHAATLDGPHCAGWNYFTHPPRTDCACRAFRFQPTPA
jgi:hypothetical protein